MSHPQRHHRGGQNQADIIVAIGTSHACSIAWRRGREKRAAAFLIGCNDGKTPGANFKVILEAAILNVRPGEEADFEAAMKIARPLIAATPGFETIEVRRCIEAPSRYLLLVTWQTLENHTVGFRQSERYPQWRILLHHFYEPFPTVEHYGDPLNFSA